MRRWVGSAVAGLAAGCGAVALVAEAGPMAVGWWAGGVFVTLALLVCLGPENGPIRWNVVIARSLRWPTVALAAAGLVVALGWTSGLLVAAAGFAAAWDVGWLGWPPRAEPAVKRRHRAAEHSRAQTAGAAEIVSTHTIDPVEVELAVTDGLTASDLCMAWRSSYVALERATDPSAKLRAVEIREVLLEELERRDAPGLEAWFRSGARAAGWPDRYLRGATPRQWGGEHWASDA